MVGTCFLALTSMIAPLMLCLMRKVLAIKIMINMKSTPPRYICRICPSSQFRYGAWYIHMTTVTKNLKWHTNI